MKQKIVFFGSDSFTIPVIEKLLSHNLVLVVTNNTTGKIVEFCKEKNIPFVVSSLKDLSVLEKIKEVNPTIAVLASYGAIIPESVINIFPNGIINIHPSLLPKYKGPTPVPAALLCGETITGVTLIKLDNEVDHGPILAQSPYNLSGNETAQDLLSILFEVGGALVEEQIIKLENGEALVETPQDHSQESWSKKIEKKDGMIDLSEIPNPEKLNNMIRAFYPWPGVWFRTTLNGQKKIVKLLPENKIQVEGKNIVSYKDFINGFGEKGKEILEKLNLS